MPTPAPSRAHRGSFVVLVCVALLWLGWGLWFTTAADTNPGGQCSGLGFGCTLTPHDFAAFAGAIVVAPLSVLIVAVTLVVRIVRINRGSPRTVWDLLLGGVLLCAGGLWVLGSVLGSL